MKRLLPFLIALLIPTLVHAQYSRWDYAATTTSGQGQLIPVLAIPYAPISFYSCTGTASSTCTVPLVTYQSATGAACPTNAQVVLQQTNTCGANADAEGNFGAWLPPSSTYGYGYTITVNNVINGPYQFSGSGCSSNTIANGCTGATTAAGATGNLMGPYTVGAGANQLPSTCTDGAIATVTDNIRGVWKCKGNTWHSVTGYADIKDWGADPTGVACSNTQIAAASTYLNTLDNANLYTSKSTLFFSKGNYRMCNTTAGVAPSGVLVNVVSSGNSVTIPIYSNVIYKGCGKDCVTLWNDPGTAALTTIMSADIGSNGTPFYESANIDVSDIGVDCNNGNVTGLSTGFSFYNVSTGSAVNLKANNCDAGIQGDSLRSFDINTPTVGISQPVVCPSCISLPTYPYGYYTSPKSPSTADSEGIWLTDGLPGGSPYNGGANGTLTIENAQVQQEQECIHIQTATNTTITTSYCETNIFGYSGNDGIKILNTSWGNNIAYNHVDGYGHNGGTPYGLGNIYSSTFVGNYAANTASAQPYSAVIAAVALGTPVIIEANYLDKALATFGSDIGSVINLSDSVAGATPNILTSDALGTIYNSGTVIASLASLKSPIFQDIISFNNSGTPNLVLLYPSYITADYLNVYKTGLQFWYADAPSTPIPQGIWSSTTSYTTSPLSAVTYTYAGITLDYYAAAPSLNVIPYGNPGSWLPIYKPGFSMEAGTGILDTPNGINTPTVRVPTCGAGTYVKADGSGCGTPSGSSPFIPNYGSTSIPNSTATTLFTLPSPSATNTHFYNVCAQYPTQTAPIYAECVNLFQGQSGTNDYLAPITPPANVTLSVDSGGNVQVVVTAYTPSSINWSWVQIF